jgi:hypothetical protein
MMEAEPVSETLCILHIYKTMEYVEQIYTQKM